MEIIDDDLINQFDIKQETKPSSLENKIITREEMPQVINGWFKMLENIMVNDIPLIQDSNIRDYSFAIDPSLNIEILQRVLGVKEQTLFSFINTLYFYSLDKILIEQFGSYKFIGIPTVIFTPLSANRFSIDF
jgi:hypothetical protein